MKCRVTVEIELEVKPRFSKHVIRDTSNYGGGKELVEQDWHKPTQSDVTEFIEETLHGVKYALENAEDNRFAPCIIKGHITGPTEIYPESSN